MKQHYCRRGSGADDGGEEEDYGHSVLVSVPRQAEAGEFDKRTVGQAGAFRQILAGESHGASNAQMWQSSILLLLILVFCRVLCPAGV